MGTLFETAISAVAGFRVASQRLRLAGKRVRFIVGGIGVAGQKNFGLDTAQTEDFAHLLLCQTVFPLAFRSDRLERKTLRIGVSGAGQSPSDFIRDFERQNHVLAYRVSGRRPIPRGARVLPPFVRFAPGRRARTPSKSFP